MLQAALLQQCCCCSTAAAALLLQHCTAGGCCSTDGPPWGQWGPAWVPSRQLVHSGGRSGALLASFSLFIIHHSSHFEKGWVHMSWDPMKTKVYLRFLQILVWVDWQSTQTLCGQSSWPPALNSAASSTPAAVLLLQHCCCSTALLEIYRNFPVDFQEIGPAAQKSVPHICIGGPVYFPVFRGPNLPEGMEPFLCI